MLEKRAADWGDKVRIIGISIDQTKEAVVKHVDDKKWTSVEHYHRAKSECSKTYSVSGVPHVMLIDTKGNIAFKGHPANREDLEKILMLFSKEKLLPVKDVVQPKMIRKRTMLMLKNLIFQKVSKN